MSRSTEAARPGRRERNKLEKRERIVTAARRLFRQKGFGKTTLQEIADVADVGFGTLYLYAKSKEDLLVQIFAVEMHAVMDASFAATLAVKPLPLQIEKFFRALIRYHNDDMRLARATFRELGFIHSAGSRKEVETVVASVYEKLGTFVTLAQQRGEIGDEFSPAEVARIVFAIYHDFLMAYLGEFVDEKGFWTQLRRSFKLLMAGLGARKTTRAAKTTKSR